MNFKKLIAGSTLALSLLGAYDVAKEMTQPNTMEAQAATWNQNIQNKIDRLFSTPRISLNKSGIYAFGAYPINDLISGKRCDVVIGGWNGQKYNSLTQYGMKVTSAYGSDWANEGYIVGTKNNKPIVLRGEIEVTGSILNGYQGMIFLNVDSYYTKKVQKIVSDNNKPKEPKSTNCDQLLSAKGKATLYGNKFITKKKGTSKDSEVFRAKSYFTYKGKKYYSAYQTDSKGNSVWRGYVEEKKVNKLNSQKDYKTCVVKGKNYGIYNNLYFTKKVSTGSKYYNKTVIAKYKYRLSNGKTYYSIYQKDKFLGYIDIKALKAK
ncbi:SH3-like domain-containing protein [Catellicoccus marimammalium]|uniref:Glycosyl hydrolase 53 n=1 Tax=Catellicoccus marimammalium M35/04/3 TaxID=1234409 RepID=K8ZAS4_9ENTE|nr:SH3-like domain-containing protein [Catellicoccus marimammalium]EKU27102.1 glycosyl hydrolase 53 [Catellicoccus marimammalium M35/04/3]